MSMTGQAGGRPAPRPSSRTRLVDAAVELLRTKGPASSGTAEMLQRAGAPRGSLYFHFPRGKDQLVVEAVALAGATTRDALVEALAVRSTPVADRVAGVFTSVAREMEDESYTRGCAVGATALETAATTGPVQQSTQEAFTSWTDVLTAALVSEGITTDEAEALADAVVSGLEGATMLARARRDPAPLLRTAAALSTAISAAHRQPSAR